MMSKSTQALLALALVVAIFFGSIFMAQATGNYEVLPSALKSGQTRYLYDAKGYMSIEEAATLTGLSLYDVYVQLQIPERVAKSTKLKEIYKEAPEYNFDAAKEALEIQLGK